jgi:citrate lyase subunit beta / citryl-CoA lyase
VSPPRPRRSALYVPGSNPRAMARASALPADVLILDLEDAVAPEAKAEARRRIVELVTSGALRPREVVVRINALDTPWGRDDLAVLQGLEVDAVLVPKVAGPAALDAVAAALGGSTPVWAMLETPRGLLEVDRIAAVAAALVVGTNDLSAELRLREGPGREALVPALARVVWAARANHCVALDGVWGALRDDDGLRAECLQGARLGFDGKTLIHPGQIAAANAIFAPEHDELRRAAAVIAAFEAPENVGRGVLVVDGRMVELLHLERARRTVALSEAIAALSSGA